MNHFLVQNWHVIKSQTNRHPWQWNSPNTKGPDLTLCCYFLLLRRRGRGDGILAVRDGGSAPVTFAPINTLIPPCRITPCPRPVTSHTPSKPTQTPQTQHSSEEKRRGEGRGLKRRGGETPGGGCQALPILVHPPSDLKKTKNKKKAGTTLPGMHSRASPWVQNLSNKEVSENHRLCGWLSNVVSFSFSVGWFWFVYFVFGLLVVVFLVHVETLGSVKSASGRWRESTGLQPIEAKRW